MRWPHRRNYVTRRSTSPRYADRYGGPPIVTASRAVVLGELIEFTVTGSSEGSANRQAKARPANRGITMLGTDGRAKDGARFARAFDLNGRSTSLR